MDAHTVRCHPAEYKVVEFPEDDTDIERRSVLKQVWEDAGRNMRIEVERQRNCVELFGDLGLGVELLGLLLPQGPYRLNILKSTACRVTEYD